MVSIPANETAYQQASSEKPNIQYIADLKNYPIWVLAGLNKEPLTIAGYDAKANDPTTWASFPLVWKCYSSNKAHYLGVGFQLGIAGKSLGITVIDLDDCIAEDGTISEYARHLVTELNTYTEYSRSGRGLHIIARGNVPKTIVPDKTSYAKVEFYDHGHYMITTGTRLEGTSETINDRQEQLLTLHSEALAIRQQERRDKRSTPTSRPERQAITTTQGNTPYGQKALQEECDELASMPEGGRNSRLNIAAFNLGQLVAGGQIEEFTAVIELTAAALKCGLEEREIEKTLSGGLEAGKRDPRKPETQAKALDVLIYGKTTIYIPPPVAQPDELYNLTDLGNAERFALRYKDTVRWCETWKSWMFFNGKCWEQDKIGRVDQLAKIIVRSIYAEAAKMEDEKLRPKLAKHAAASESNRAVRAMLDRAKSELPAIPEDFNQQLYLVNCENGTLDLQTGELRPHSSHDMLTRCIKISYNPLAWSTKWKDFVTTILGGDADLISFMQQALGMSLCGDTSEQCLFICHGMGSNGKTTMLETVRLILASYACAANIETFQMRKTETIGNDVAELYGARLVTASETKLGGRLNEAFVKKATGKEPLRARRLHENEFEFMPEFTLWLAVNHKPVVLDTSKGMWRRVRFVPFNVTFEENQIDPQFGNKLLEEAEGILAWLVQGCREWVTQGRLTVPQVVKEATEGYRAEMDIVANFLRDECILQKGAKVSTKHLIERFESWCGHNSEKFDAKILKNSLKERGLHSQRGTGGSYYWQDIGLIAGPGLVKDEIWGEGSEGTEIDLSSDSEGSEGSEGENGVNQELKNPPDATLNSRSLPSLPSLSTDSEVVQEAENLPTPSTKLVDKARLLYTDLDEHLEEWKINEKVVWFVPGQDMFPETGGLLWKQTYKEQILSLIESGNTRNIQSAIDTIEQKIERKRPGRRGDESDWEEEKESE